jgi:hypothetical protein
MLRACFCTDDALYGLRVYVNDPTRAGATSLEVPLRLPRLLQLDDDSAYVGLVAAGMPGLRLESWSFQVKKRQSMQQQSLPPPPPTTSGGIVSRAIDLSTTNESTADEGSYDGWAALQMQYTVQWPLHLVLAREALRQYNRVFSILFSVKRANFEVSPSMIHCLEMLQRNFLD